MSEQTNKRQKSNYHSHKRRKNAGLVPGLKGFLCFCNFREKHCIKEAMNILNEYVDETALQFKNIQSEIMQSLDDISVSENLLEISAEIDDVEDELAKEIELVKKKYAAKKLFQVVDSGAKNISFIRTTLDDPVQLVSTIMKSVVKTRGHKTRYLLRLIPIENTCKANLNDIKESAAKLIDKYFSNKPKTFSVVYNHRNNNKLRRDVIIKEVAAIVENKKVKHKVNLTDPHLTVIIEIIRNMCLLSVVPDYNRCKKYNLHQLSNRELRKFPARESFEVVEVADARKKVEDLEINLPVFENIESEVGDTAKKILDQYEYLQMADMETIDDVQSIEKIGQELDVIMTESFIKCYKLDESEEVQKKENVVIVDIENENM